MKKNSNKNSLEQMLNESLESAEMLSKVSEQQTEEILRNMVAEKLVEGTEVKEVKENAEKTESAEASKESKEEMKEQVVLGSDSPEELEDEKEEKEEMENDGMEMEKSEEEEEEKVDDMMSEPEKGEEDVIDMTAAPTSDLIKVFKKMGNNDEFEVVRNNDEITIKDEDKEYLIKLKESYMMGEMDEDIEVLDLDDESDLDENEMMMEDSYSDAFEDDDEFMDDELLDDDDEDLMMGDDEFEIGDDDMEKNINRVMSKHKSVHEEEMEEGVSRNLANGRKQNRKPEVFKQYGASRLRPAQRMGMGESKEIIKNLIKENKILEAKVKLLTEKANKYETGLIKIKENIDKAAKLNYSTYYVNRLVTEHYPSKEKVGEIVSMFGKVESLDEAKKLYKKIDKNLLESKVVNDTEKIIEESVVNSTIVEEKTGSSTRIVEEKVAFSQDLTKMKKLIETLENRKSF